MKKKKEPLGFIESVVPPLCVMISFCCFIVIIGAMIALIGLMIDGFTFLLYAGTSLIIILIGEYSKYSPIRGAWRERV